MASSKTVLARMDQRVSELTAGLDGFVRAFVNSARFTGPSLYFHRKTLRRRALHSTAASLLDDDEFFDALYATLAAWGLHRMGPGNTKLRNLDDIRASVQGVAAELDALWSMDITDAAETPADLAEAVWSILTRLRVSIAKAQLVANSKALHHLLPAVVPPMDREYTFRFFYGRTMLSVDERTAFTEMFTRLLGVAAAQKIVIRRLIDGIWNTGPAKILDNAVVGYMIAREDMGPAAIVTPVAHDH